MGASMSTMKLLLEARGLLLVPLCFLYNMLL